MVLHGTLDTAACGVMAEQTLLAPDVMWRSTGFASRIACQNPGEHSLKLGTPGLKDGRPLAFKTSIVVTASAGFGSGRALSALPEPAKAGTTIRGLGTAVPWSFSSAYRAGETGREMGGYPPTDEIEPASCSGFDCMITAQTAVRPAKAASRVGLPHALIDSLCSPFGLLSVVCLTSFGSLRPPFGQPAAVYLRFALGSKTLRALHQRMLGGHPPGI